MFPGLLNSTATINRMQAVGTNGRRQMAQKYTNVPCNLQPFSSTTAGSILLTELKFSLGQAYNAYFNTGQDVRQGDELVIGGNTYVVKLVQPWSGGPASYVSAMVELQIL